jgi:hypothetical protein
VGWYPNHIPNLLQANSSVHPRLLGIHKVSVFIFCRNTALNSIDNPNKRHGLYCLIDHRIGRLYEVEVLEYLILGYSQSGSVY